MNGITFAYPNAADRILAPRDRTPTSTSFLPDVAELEEHDGGQHREEEERDGRALTEVASVEADLVGERSEEVRGVDRTAAREHPHDVEIGEGENRREQDHHRQDRPEQRQGDVAEAPPRTGAVDLGRLVVLAGNGDEAGEHDDGEERQAPPD